ncbi:MAG TPA: cupin domain-containing protein [Anaerolineae bacterium]|nr:cupin domain-containing protein [Anaerolineae bacterium]HQH38882.1 cupin domain-containing protein [Anaerolineae bacterium]
MLIKEASHVTPVVVQEGIGIRWLLTEKEGAPNFAMRVIELQPGAVFTPHQHPYEHEIYVLEGTGVATHADGDVGIMRPGVFLLVPPDEVHGYRNTGATPLKFICVIPLQNQG